MTFTEDSTGGSWVDVAASSCSLPTTAKPLRLAEFDALFATEITEATRLSETSAAFVLRSDPSVAGRVAELCARETQCCSFFEFTLHVTTERLELRVRVPDAHTAVLAALVDRAPTSVEQLSP